MLAFQPTLDPFDTAHRAFDGLYILEQIIFQARNNTPQVLLPSLQVHNAIALEEKKLF